MPTTVNALDTVNLEIALTNTVEAVAGPYGRKHCLAMAALVREGKAVAEIADVLDPGWRTRSAEARKWPEATAATVRAAINAFDVEHGLRAPTLPERIEALAAGSIYVERTDLMDALSESFRARVRGATVLARVERMGGGAGMVWTVRVEDPYTDHTDAVHTAVVTGTQYRAAQVVCGLLAGVVLTLGGEPVLPTPVELRTYLAGE